MTTIQTLRTIDLDLLSSVSGGAGKSAASADDAPRTWGDVGKDYVQACVEGAGEALMFGGKPKNAKAALGTAGVGCAMGVGMKAITDGTSKLLGR